MSMRVGTGFDAHAFDSSTPLNLAGLFWPGEPGLRGHSDGDAVIHAIVDALLGAAGLGDIGSRFGTSQPEYRDASSRIFLTETINLLTQQGWQVANVCVQLIANQPQFSARREEAQQQLSELVGAPVSIGATTSDGLGFTGRGEGVAVFATALILARGNDARS